jgi:hypothetical protein
MRPFEVMNFGIPLGYTQEWLLLITQ